MKSKFLKPALLLALSFASVAAFAQADCVKAIDSTCGRLIARTAIPLTYCSNVSTQYMTDAADAARYGYVRSTGNNCSCTPQYVSSVNECPGGWYSVVTDTSPCGSGKTIPTSACVDVYGYSVAGDGTGVGPNGAGAVGTTPRNALAGSGNGFSSGQGQGGYADSNGVLHVSQDPSSPECSCSRTIGTTSDNGGASYGSGDSTGDGTGDSSASSDSSSSSSSESSSSNSSGGGS